MSGQHLTQSEYALQPIVILFGELLIQLEEARLTLTYQDVFRFCEPDKISYLVTRFWNTREPPFVEWAEEWLKDGEV
jgi:hypothetical protein